jgi:hypothetical protein
MYIKKLKINLQNPPVITMWLEIDVEKLKNKFWRTKIQEGIDEESEIYMKKNVWRRNIYRLNIAVAQRLKILTNTIPTKVS